MNIPKEGIKITESPIRREKNTYSIISRLNLFSSLMSLICHRKESYHNNVIKHTPEISKSVPGKLDTRFGNRLTSDIPEPIIRK